MKFGNGFIRALLRRDRTLYLGAPSLMSVSVSLQNLVEREHRFCPGYDIFSSGSAVNCPFRVAVIAKNFDLN